MAYKIKDGLYTCSLCGRSHQTYQLADSCRDSHEVLYVPLTPAELNRLVSFIYSKDDSLITEGLVTKLQRFSRQRPVV